MAKTWFITGASRGFGREWTIAALERGDTVAATARDTATLDDLVAQFGDKLLPLQLDVTDRDAVFAAVKDAHDRFGRLDVVVNNAGYGQFGMIEEISEAGGPRPDRDQRVRRAVGHPGRAALPARAGLRATSCRSRSIGGISAFPNIGMYHASKWALEGMSQALAAGGRRLRHQGHAHRAGRLLHRLVRLLGPARDARTRPTTASARRPRSCAPPARRPRATRWPPARRC